MKYMSIFAVLAALIVAGCGSKEEPTAESTTGSTAAGTGAPAGGLKAISYEKGAKKKGDKGVCAVCMVKAGKATDEEEVKLVMDYKDRTYVFCNEAEEAEFISDPKKYAGE